MFDAMLFSGSVLLLVSLSLMVGAKVAGAEHSGFWACLVVSFSLVLVSYGFDRVFPNNPVVSAVLVLVFSVLLIRWLLRTGVFGAVFVGAVATLVQVLGVLVLASVG